MACCYCISKITTHTKAVQPVQYTIDHYQWHIRGMHYMQSVARVTKVFHSGSWWPRPCCSRWQPPPHRLIKLMNRRWPHWLIVHSAALPALESAAELGVVQLWLIVNLIPRVVVRGLPGARQTLCHATTYCYLHPHFVVFRFSLRLVSFDFWATNTPLGVETFSKAAAEEGRCQYRNIFTILGGGQAQTQSFISIVLPWIQCKLGKQCLLNRVTLSYRIESYPGSYNYHNSVCWFKKIYMWTFATTSK